MATRARGFTYLMVLFWIALSGVMLMAVSRSWLMDARRERDTELVYRGEQIREALSAYAAVPVSQGGSRAPQRLDELLEDRRSGQVQRHLRRVWRDPITNSLAWGLVKDGQGGIVGVFSNSGKKPLLGPAGVRTYRDWRFDIAPGVASPASGSSEANALSGQNRPQIAGQDTTSLANEAAAP